MSETMDCVCFTKDFSKLIANFQFWYTVAMATEAERTRQLNRLFLYRFRPFSLRKKSSHQIYNVF